MGYDRIIDKALKKSILPMIIAGLIGVLAMLIDSMFIGRFLGTAQMAAYGFVSPVLLIITMIGGVISFGTSILISGAYAKGDIEKASRAFSRTLIIAVILFILVACGVIFCGESIVEILSHDEIDQLTKTNMLDYLKGFMPSFLVLLLLELFIHITNLEGKKGVVYLCVFTTLIVDIVLDAVNVFVWHKGLWGMALASSISYYAAFVIYLYFIICKSSIRFKIKSLDWKSFPDTLKKGLPVGVNRLVTALRMIFLNKILIITAAESAVAALSVNNSVMQIILAVCNGVGGACTILAGFISADKDAAGAKTLLKKSIRYAFIGSLLVSLFCAIFSRPIAYLFTSGEQGIMTEASLSIIFGAIYVPIYAITYQVYSYLHGIDRKSLSIPLVILQNGTIAVIAAYFLGRKYGSIGVWIALPLAALIVLVITFLVSLLLAKKEGMALEQYVYFRKKDYLDPNTVCEFNIKSCDDLSERIESLRDFCCNLTNANKAEAVCFCVLETVKYIYQSDSNKYSDSIVSIRVVVENQDITIRIRDNRNSQEIDDKAKTQNNELPIGIQKEIKYSKIVNINNRIIRITEGENV